MSASLEFICKCFGIRKSFPFPIQCVHIYIFLFSPTMDVYCVFNEMEKIVIYTQDKTLDILDGFLTRCLQRGTCSTFVYNASLNIRRAVPGDTFMSSRRIKQILFVNLYTDGRYTDYRAGLLQTVDTLITGLDYYRR